MNMGKISFSMYGTGYRANILLGVAKALPEIFEVKYLIEANPQRAEIAGDKWGLPVISDVTDVDKEALGDFVVISKSWGQMPVLMKQLNDMEIFVLAETFQFSTPEALADYYVSIEHPELIQTAEQYIFQPMHEARLHLIENGAIGTVTQAYIAAAHGYHGTSLLRHYLGAGFENASVYAREFELPVVKGDSRTGYPETEEITMEKQQMAIFDFGDKVAEFDFTGEQYFNQLRGSRVLVRGVRGEIADEEVHGILDHKTPVHYPLRRYQTGLSTHVGAIHTDSISAGTELCYKNPYREISFKDDELAIAKMLKRMGEYAQGGEPCYSFEEGCQDQYLSILIKQSAEQRRELTMTTQVWAK